jgi:hypothetical protein
MAKDGGPRISARALTTASGSAFRILWLTRSSGGAGHLFGTFSALAIAASAFLFVCAEANAQQDCRKCARLPTAGACMECAAKPENGGSAKEIPLHDAAATSPTATFHSRKSKPAVSTAGKHKMLRGTVAEIILAGRCYLQMLEQYEPYFRRLKQSLKSLYFPPRIPTQPTVFSPF